MVWVSLRRLRVLSAIVMLLLAYSSFPFSGRARVEAAPQTCNLAPNAAFEQGTPTTVKDWGLATTRLATLSIVSNPVQSGSRALKITVRQPGDAYVTTTPEGFSIPAAPNTTYVYSIRLFSSDGARAGIRVLETDSGGRLTAYRTLAQGGGTGRWETLEASFVTTPLTSYVSLRLMHNLSAGTFIWDDPMLWAQASGMRCADMRHYITQSTPGFRMCASDGGCIDGWKDQFNEFIYGYTLPGGKPGDRDYILHNDITGMSIGIQKNYDSTTNQWRCFANRGKSCGNPNMQYPPQALKISMLLPVLGGAISNNRVTPGAVVTHDWVQYDVRSFNIKNNKQVTLGMNWHREYAFIAASVDFGGGLGKQSNVLVIEAEAIHGRMNPKSLGGGERLERYFYVRGYGRVRQLGAEDTVCRAAVAKALRRKLQISATDCQGYYDSSPLGFGNFIYMNAGDYNANSIMPYTKVDW